MAFKYYLNEYEYTPSNAGGFTLDINRVMENGSYQYVYELNGNVSFNNKNGAYNYILRHGDCQKIIFTIREICSLGTFDIFEGYFTNRDCKDNPDMSIVDAKISQDSAYKCLIDNYDRNFNFLEVPNVVSATYEDTPVFIFQAIATLAIVNIPLFGSYIQVFGGVSPFLGFAAFAREQKTTYCQGGVPVPPIGTGWQLEYDNCAGKGTSTWTRKPPVFVSPLLLNANFADTTAITPAIPATPVVTGANEDWYLMSTIVNPVVTISLWVDYNVIRNAPVELDNGRPLIDVINYGLNQHCPIIDVQSQFLNNVVNPVTGQSPSSTEGIQVHALSDIKDPNATEQATREDINVKDLLGGYCNGKLNCFWRVDNLTNRLTIEHYNDLNNLSVIDLTSIDGGKWLKKQYEYDNTDVPKAEEFPSLDSSVDFTGVDIEFNNACASGKKAYNTDKFFSEVESIITNPDSYGGDGFVMITPESLAPLDPRAENGIITGDYAPNMPQAMANLQEKFWKYYRPFPNGKMNFIDQSFTKTRPVKKLTQISVPICCLFFFAPYSAFVGLDFTEGQLVSASYNFQSGFMTLNLIY